MEHAQLIEAALVAYLTGLNDGADPPNSLWPASLMVSGTPPVLRISAGEDILLKDGQCVVCSVGKDFTEEYPPSSGNRWCECAVELKTPVTQLSPSQLASNPVPPTALANHRAAANVLENAVLVQNFPDLLTAASNGLTCFGVTDRLPVREQTKDYWLSGFKFRLYSCPSEFPN